MSFKENLLKKIEIDKLAKKVTGSLGTPDSGRRIDKETVRHLLEMGPRKFRKERDNDLYVLETDPRENNILVLDNELAIYTTTAEDIALRKSPTVKEMISIRNVIRILSDSDVIISKKEDSVKTIQKECTDMLDLSFDESDIDAIEKDGQASLEGGYTDGVIESLSLFAELLKYAPPPKAFRMSNYKIIGVLTQKDGGEKRFGPLVIYSIIHNVIKLIDDQISTLDKEKTEFVHKVAMGKEKASKEGTEVFRYLRDAVVRQMR
ncbi:hypothetical protein [Desulfonema magnum]|uniref:Uncharacterized protein n=1 Tax=Desulfonema magnum TaxID=45655 RepID=A0A975GLY9_9BACT|nr:hypothetical protein [Desulfonema magnum]QTA86351.1 Uncharacterized protein dnm_023740 [Desulfonema magnum]